MMSSDDKYLLHAYVDGELDAAGALEMERRLRDEPDLAKQRDQLLALKAVIGAHAPREAAPDRLCARIETMLRSETAPKMDVAAGDVFGQRRLAGLAAAIAVTAGVAGYFASPRTSPENDMLEALVASQMRAQISGRPFDIASSDRHTVKPWLAGRLPVAAIVLDLVEDGFPLVGGRVDVVDGVAAPTLVYKRREHLVSLTELPSRGVQAPSQRLYRGYTIEEWGDKEHFFVAVSDLAPAELQSFAGIFRDIAAQEFPVQPLAR